MIYYILLIIWVHFIADFVLQSDRMAINKSSDNLWLSIHSLCYGLPFLALFFIFGIKFIVFNIVAHFIIDWITSKGTSKLWKENKRHWFFVLIGLDQAIHLTILITSFYHII